VVQGRQRLAALGKEERCAGCGARRRRRRGAGRNGGGLENERGWWLRSSAGGHGVCALTHGTEGEGERGGSGESEGETETEHGRIQIEVGDDLGKVGAEMGRLRADLDLEPKSKVEAHLMIYKTY